jgi:hypothetical protein
MITSNRPRATISRRAFRLTADTEERLQTTQAEYFAPDLLHAVQQVVLSPNYHVSLPLNSWSIAVLRKALGLA